MDVRQLARASFVVVAWLFLVCAIAQVFLAGLGVFAGSANFATHRDFGYLFGWLTLILLVLALVGRMPRAIVGMSVGLIVLFFLQSVFIAAWRSGLPAIAALHPVNALAIVGLSIAIIRRGREYARPPIGTAATSERSAIAAESRA